MNELEVKETLRLKLGFSSFDIQKLEYFVNLLTKYNIKYNLISKNSESLVWHRHILDSAQLNKFVDTKENYIMADFGTGAGFPGVVLAIFNKNRNFHVKLYEKSPVKREFLRMIREKLNVRFEVCNNIFNENIDADIITCRAFKKLREIIVISRETLKKPHKIVILKGKNAQEEINNVSLEANYSYKLEKSITDDDSKIIVINVSLNEK